MGVFDAMHRGIDAIREVPGVRHARRWAFEKRFANDTNVNYWRGIYDSFEAAQADAPPTKGRGYDNDESAALYGSRFEPLLKDYPAMFWLQQALNAGARDVFDLGGHAGMKFYAFEPHLHIPQDCMWTVCDVPAVVRRGRSMAQERGVSERLAFTDRWQDMNGRGVLFASGSLQYLPLTLGQMLDVLEERPAWLVINTTALHPTRSFFTLNSIGTAFCPYRITKEADFIRDVQRHGYRLLDRWETPKDFRIPFEKGFDMNRYVGLCFRREQAG